MFINTILNVYVIVQMARSSKSAIEMFAVTKIIDFHFTAYGFLLTTHIIVSLGSKELM